MEYIFRNISPQSKGLIFRTAHYSAFINAAFGSKSCLKLKRPNCPRTAMFHSASNQSFRSQKFSSHRNTHDCYSGIPISQTARFHEPNFVPHGYTSIEFYPRFLELNDFSNQFFFYIYIYGIMPELRGLFKNNDRARSTRSLFLRWPRSGGIIRFNAPFHCFKTSRSLSWSLRWKRRSLSLPPRSVLRA